MEFLHVYLMWTVRLGLQSFLVLTKDYVGVPFKNLRVKKKDKILSAGE